MYFSRAPIPWERDGAPAGLASQTSFAGARRHVGIYGYRVSGLLRMASLQRTALEQHEKLEQLRALENGLEIRVADSVEQPGPDVNTAADLERVTSLLGALMGCNATTFTIFHTRRRPAAPGLGGTTLAWENPSQPRMLALRFLKHRLHGWKQWI